MTTLNSVALNESVVYARYPGGLYGYRTKLGMLPSAEYSTYFEDFQNTVTTNVPLGWSATTIDTGATLATYTAGNDNSGVIRITSDGASEGVSIYRPKAVALSGKRFFIEVRARTAAVTDTDLQFGLTSVTATSNPEDLWNTAADSFITFGLIDGSGTPVLSYDKSNAGPTTDTPTGTAIAQGLMVNNVYSTLAIAYNGDTTAGVGSISGWVNGVKVITNSVAAKIPETIVLSPFLGARGGDGAIGTIDFDYIRYSVQR